MRNFIDKILFESIQSIPNTFLFEKKFIYEYGCVMLDFEFTEIKSIHSKIDKEDLYEEEDNDRYGLEKETHITLLYGLHKEVKLDEVKNIIDEFTFPNEITISKVSLFEKEKYGVLKFDVSSKLLSKVNKELRVLPFTNDYDEYKPHLTIAYLKSGKGKKYVSMFNNKKEYELAPKNCIFSQPNGTKTKIKLKKEK